MTSTNPPIPKVQTTENLGKCPECGRPAILEFRPFCSLRCADADLGKWISEKYTVPLKPETDDE